MAAFVSGAFQLSLFGVVMLVSAVFMFRGSSRRLAPPPESRPLTLRLILAPALLVGGLTGLVGVGGGFLIVPTLALLGKVPIRIAIGTSLVVIALNAAAAFVGYLGQVEVPWLVMAAFATLATTAAIGGSWLVPFIPQHALRRSFATFLVLMGVLILYENRAVLSPGRLPAATPSAVVTTGH